ANLKLDELMNITKNVSETLSFGDIIENHIYGDQNWEMQEIHGIITCGLSSYYINTLKDKPETTLLNFASDLNKTSIKNINKKNIVNADEYFKNKSIEDYIYMNAIFRSHLKD